MNKVKAAWLWDVGDTIPRAAPVRGSNQALCTARPWGTPASPL